MSRVACVIRESSNERRTDEVAVVAPGALDNDDPLVVAALAELVRAAVTALLARASLAVAVVGRGSRGGAGEGDAEAAVELADRGARGAVERDARVLCVVEVRAGRVQGAVMRDEGGEGRGGPLGGETTTWGARHQEGGRGAGCRGCKAECARSWSGEGLHRCEEEGQGGGAAAAHPAAASFSADSAALTRERERESSDSLFPPPRPSPRPCGATALLPHTMASAHTLVPSPAPRRPS